LSDPGYRIVVLAPTARDTGLTAQILADAGLESVPCTDIDGVLAALGAGAGAVVLTEEAVLRDPAGKLVAALDAQPAWSDVPVLVLARGGSQTAMTDRVLDALGNATLLDRPVRIATLLSAIRGALRARRRQYELRDHLEERQRSEAALAASEARYRAVGETIPFGVWVSEADGRFQYVSDAFLDVLGLDLATVRERGWQHSLPAPEREEAQRRWSEAIASGAMFDLQHRIVDREGALRVVLVRGVPLRDERGAIVSWVGMNLDVTEKWRMEDAMARVGRLDSVALLAGGIAHDFNNILTAILGNVALAARRVPQGSPAAQRLEAAEAACTQAQSLVGQLLTFSKGGAPVRRTIDLDGVLRDATRFAMQGSAAAATIDIPPGLWCVEADAGQINQVVHNLVLNAEQAMQGRGTVVVRAENVVLDASSGLPLPPGRYVAVSVTDGGVGIAPHDLERIFDLFFTTKPRGSGLGLATAHSIVHRHGGHVQVRSELGAGSTFTFHLPATSGQPAPDAGNMDPVPALHGRVLVMDDDDAVRDVARETLAFLGYTVEVARDGAEAISRYEAARAEARPFDLLLLDLTVPGGMGGAETLARLRAVDPDIVAIVASGYSHDPVMADHRAYGFAAAVEKPYDVQKLGAVLASLPLRAR
jgi:two-component system cell cycle sensor histidine kinase/response regulator CckA